MRSVAIIIALQAGCLFNGAQTEGLPCNNDEECGRGLQCVERVCGGPEIVAEGETETDAEDDESGESSGEPLPEDEDDVRDMCEAADTQCLDGDTLRRCTDDGKLETVGCKGVCGEHWHTLGCAHINEDDVDNCVCMYEHETCDVPGERECSGNGLAQCDGEIMQYQDCDEICLADGYRGAAYCDGGTCFCDSSTCAEAAQRCTDSNTIAGCWGGTWYPESCTEICRDNGFEGSFGCFFFPGEDSWCSCN